MSTARTVMIGTVKLLPKVVGWLIGIIRVAFPSPAVSIRWCLRHYFSEPPSINHFYFDGNINEPRKVYLTHQHTSILDIERLLCISASIFDPVTRQKK